MTFDGLKVYVTPDRPKMQLSPRVREVLAPDFIAETNEWMARFFGMWNQVPDGDFIVNHLAGCVYMNPRTYERFKAAVMP